VADRVELEHVYEAIRREEQARDDLAVYLRNAHLRRVERDDDHEQRLRAEISNAEQGVEAAIAARRAAFHADDDSYEPKKAA
jgi:hypothetical protein